MHIVHPQLARPLMRIKFLVKMGTKMQIFIFDHSLYRQNVVNPVLHKKGNTRCFSSLVYLFLVQDRYTRNAVPQ